MRLSIMVTLMATVAVVCLPSAAVELQAKKTTPPAPQLVPDEAQIRSVISRLSQAIGDDTFDQDELLKVVQEKSIPREEVYCPVTKPLDEKVGLGCKEATFQIYPDGAVKVKPPDTDRALTTWCLASNEQSSTENISGVLVGDPTVFVHVRLQAQTDELGYCFQAKPGKV